MAVIIHECGHLFAMLICKSPPDKIKISLFEIKITNSSRQLNTTRQNIFIIFFGPLVNFICFILFYLGNPIYALLAGVYAGKDRKDLWIVPIITAVLFLAGAWSIFDKNETVFVLYALIYLLLGIVAMFVSGFKKKS